VEAKEAKEEHRLQSGILQMSPQSRRPERNGAVLPYKTGSGGTQRSETRQAELPLALAGRR
jgi:hypothetical protein